MNFKIYVVSGKLSKFFAESIKEYEKRLSRYCKIKLVLFKNEEKLLKEISEGSFVIGLNTNSALISSEEFANKINTFGISGTPNITIVIGCPTIQADESISISKMEMDRGLTTTILFEQIYRAYRIIHNEPYHK